MIRGIAVTLFAFVMIGSITITSTYAFEYYPSYANDDFPCVPSVDDWCAVDYNYDEYDDEYYDEYYDDEFYDEYYEDNYIYDQYGNLRLSDERSFVTVIDDYMEWNVYDSKGNPYSWTLDTAVYDELIINGDDLSTYNAENPLYLTDDYGTEFTTIGLDGFVYGAFGEIIDDIYDNSDSDSDFIYQVWYIVSQLTEYSSDVEDGYYIGDEGRYALDTLYRGGGDCEDLVILVADMLISSKHTQDWIIQYVFLDADDPTNSNDSNHVVLYVDDGEYGYYIEATGIPDWDYYPDGIKGWYFDVV